MKFLYKAFRVVAFFSILLGIIYPLFITGIGYITAKDKTTGSMLTYKNQVIGSKLIGQNMPNNLFQSRPSAGDYNPLASGGSNYSVGNKANLKEVQQRITDAEKRYGSKQDIPEDMIYASGSGLDPDITVANSLYQMNYVAKTNHIDSRVIKTCISKNSINRWFGADTVNVLQLNICVDKQIDLSDKK